MKINKEALKDKKNKNIPDVGQVWSHGYNSPWHYMRISDRAGARALGMENTNDDRFYSVGLKDGRIASTELFDDIVIYPEAELIIK